MTIEYLILLKPFKKKGYMVDSVFIQKIKE